MSNGKISILNRRNLSSKALEELGCRGVECFDVSRTSPVGNPFFMHSEQERNAVCDAYELNFHILLGETKARAYLDEMLMRLRAGQDIALVCWCAPKRCHAETIRAWLLKQLSK